MEPRIEGRSVGAPGLRSPGSGPGVAASSTGWAHARGPRRGGHLMDRILLAALTSSVGLFVAACLHPVPARPVMVWRLRHMLALPAYVAGWLHYGAFTFMGAGLLTLPLVLGTVVFVRKGWLAVRDRRRGMLLAAWFQLQVLLSAGCLSFLDVGVAWSGGLFGNGLATLLAGGIGQIDATLVVALLDAALFCAIAGIAPRTVLKALYVLWGAWADLMERLWHMVWQVLRKVRHASVWGDLRNRAGAYAGAMKDDLPRASQVTTAPEARPPEATNGATSVASTAPPAPEPHSEDMLWDLLREILPFVLSEGSVSQIRQRFSRANIEPEAVRREVRALKVREELERNRFLAGMFERHHVHDPVQREQCLAAIAAEPRYDEAWLLGLLPSGGGSHPEPPRGGVAGPPTPAGTPGAQARPSGSAKAGPPVSSSNASPGRQEMSVAGSQPECAPTAAWNRATPNPFERQVLPEALWAVAAHLPRGLHAKAIRRCLREMASRRVSLGSAEAMRRMREAAASVVAQQQAWEEDRHQHSALTGIERHVMDAPPVDFDDVAGMESLKSELITAVELPILHPEVLKNYVADGHRSRGILVYGAPGCGKSYFARAAAGEFSRRFGLKVVNVPLEWVKGQHWSKHIQALAEAFDYAEAHAPCIVLWDELDALCSDPQKTRRKYDAELSAQFKQRLEGLSQGDALIIHIATTNYPWNLELPLLRPGRFDSLHELMPPDEEARRQFMALRLAGIRLGNDIVPQKVLDWTRGCTVAEIQGYLDAVTQLPLQAWQAAGKTGEPRPVSMADFAQERPRLNRKSYEAWRLEAQRALSSPSCQGMAGFIRLSDPAASHGVPRQPSPISVV
jgi:hypothetical protein